MGCITSTSKLNELRGHENVFRVRVAHLQPTPGTPVIRSGYLELTPRELIFQTPGCEPIVWALQHLRRYGLNGDLFSFEAGRRCMSGPGIYTFRVHNAEELYPMFQRYINAVNTDAFAQVERERVNSAHSVSVMMGGGRSEGNPQGNNYLEPAPLMSRQLGSSHSESSSASASMPLPLNDAPLDDCPPNLLSPLLMPNSCADQPLRVLQECCKDAQSAMDLLATPPSGNRLSMRRRTLDLPPQESAPPPAPVLSPSNNEAIHMYANVDALIFDLSNERCYENVSRLELPLPPPREPVVASQEPATPTSLAGSSGVNYIVLDLDQPKSPAAPAGSPKATFNGFGSGLSLVSTPAPPVTAPVTPEASAVLEVPPPPPIQSKSLSSVSALAGTEAAESPANKKVESTGTQGYSTIDFIRTYALNKSSTEMPDLVTHRQHPAHDEELRITRHSKCIRKAYSISE
ncbi:uncharacterized protein LOC110183852 [Drosophila serrata]|uniref:uncharacterized protein LOC110183852 n=1 Tax=Drosophila serrata TaxID=7274 RepID=UPI000A1D0E7D|nr:uncharacterized protein LOC110183852 [Drosophila serrata]XP_020807862.1 uncharacterized protein LOC110183852 [Drosophila serrata]XP_020807863.1 uncharacterized protein LOC110183852 [Drosophila serrata]XP_020807864.1 uncharacterized protein LOC110183852 [Drosophila serrata]